MTDAAQRAPSLYRKLIADDALAIVAQRKAGDKVVDIARAHGITRAHVYRILRGQSWSSATGIVPAMSPQPRPAVTTGNMGTVA